MHVDIWKYRSELIYAFEIVDLKLPVLLSFKDLSPLMVWKLLVINNIFIQTIRLIEIRAIFRSASYANIHITGRL